MTGFNTYLSLLKLKVDISHHKVIVCVNHFGLYRKNVSLICSLCVMVTPPPPPLPYFECGDPESGTDPSQKEVSACISWYRLHTHRVNATSYCLCSFVYIYKNNIHVSIKISNAEGTCIQSIILLQVTIESKN